MVGVDGRRSSMIRRFSAMTWFQQGVDVLDAVSMSGRPVGLVPAPDPTADTRHGEFGRREQAAELVVELALDFRPPAGCFPGVTRVCDPGFLGHFALEPLLVRRAFTLRLRSCRVQVQPATSTADAPALPVG
jgi:hypothetical protein